ncbi:MAG: hypothetical protein K8F91_22710 [Candidatus Obscuribacterales bacterium]|nr:hypothetical protein [Candidatus Obscuribacterales bacterium]
MLITRQSLISGIVHTLRIPVTVEQLEAWMAGASIQDAMPQLEPSLRIPHYESLMTGITAEEWNDIPEL